MEDQANVCTELDQRQYDALACDSYMCSHRRARARMERAVAGSGIPQTGFETG